MGNTGSAAPAETGIVCACGKRHREPRLTAPGTPCDRAATVRQTGGRVLDESATGVLQAGSTHFPPEKHMLDYPEYTLGIQARYGEAGTDGKIRLGALANWFQEAAGHNASALGFGDERLFAEGKAWILTRMAFRIKDLPSPGDKVNIRTWPAKLEHLGHRGYEVYNASDELIVAAVSAWTVLDLSTRRLTALPDEADATAPDGFPQAPHGLLHVIRRTDSGDDVCRAVTRWTQKVRLP